MNNESFEKAVQELLEQRATVMEAAISEMCRHYQCLPSRLSLNKTDNRNAELLVKDDPGLAYKIEVIFEADGARVVAEPIHLNSKSQGGIGV